MKTGRKFSVRGRVQGVFFRASGKREAERLGLSGWIRNCENGDVEGIVNGEAEAVASFAKWLAQGPRMASVEKLTLTECDYQSFKNFEVR